MVDDLKKKKADGKRIALGQKHEVDYLKKIAKEQLAIIESKDEGPVKWVGVSRAKLRRICKALLKCLKQIK